MYQTTTKQVPNQYFFYRHQFALMDPNIFMTQIGSIVVILSHSEFFLKDIFIFLRLFWVFFFMSETLFLDCHQEILFCNANIEMSYCNITFIDKTKKMVNKSWSYRIYDFCVPKIIKHLAKKSFNESNGTPATTLEHTHKKNFLTIFFINFLSLFYCLKILLTTLSWLCI